MILVKPSFQILNIFGSARSIEYAGRTCYKSEDKITNDSAERFVKMILKRGHESVIEHSSLSTKIICDRGVTHEIVRHRLCAYSQESTRYCNYKGGVTFVIPPWVNMEPGEYSVIFEDLDTPAEPWFVWGKAMMKAERRYIRLLELGWSPQQARSVLPNSLKTEIVVTANFREWRHIFKLRCSPAAHPQMREIMIPLWEECKRLIPVIFDGLA